MKASPTLAALIAAFFALSGAVSVIILVAARMSQAQRYHAEEMAALNS